MPQQAKIFAASLLKPERQKSGLSAVGEGDKHAFVIFFLETNNLVNCFNNQIC